MAQRSDRREEIGQFLRARRESLPGQQRRRSRTPGLRREDVADLGNISVDYYTRLEQGRAASLPSPQVADALARALQLTAAERAHLYRLTGRAAPEPSHGEEPRAGLLFVLDQLPDTPAQIVSDLGDVLAQNSAADEIFAWVVREGIGTANVYEHWFCHEHVRQAFPEQLAADYSAAQAGELRTAVARRELVGDRRGRQLVDELAGRSEDFRHAWQREEVFDGRDKTIWIDTKDGSLHAHVLIDGRSSQRLVVFEAGQPPRREDDEAAGVAAQP